MENSRSFIVVQFIDLPFEGIANCVVVPDLWLIVLRLINQKVFVCYPDKEDPEFTRDRVKRLEGYNEEWRFYKAEIKHVSHTYEDAEKWIAMRDSFGPQLEVYGTQNSSKRNYHFKIKIRLRLNPYQNPQKPLISDQLYYQGEENFENLEKSVSLPITSTWYLVLKKWQSVLMIDPRDVTSVVLDLQNFPN